jgi:hypothetical protein
MGLAETYEESQSGGKRKYFKPNQHDDAKALLVEYKGFEPNHTEFNETKPAVKVDITVFNDGAEPDVYTNQYLTGGALVGFLKTKSVGDVFIKKFTMLPKQGNFKPARAFTGVDTKETFDEVKAYYEQREAEANAAAEAMSGDTPPWAA